MSGSTDALSDLDVDNQEQLVKYLKFFKSKRDQGAHRGDGRGGACDRARASKVRRVYDPPTPHTLAAVSQLDSDFDDTKNDRCETPPTPRGLLFLARDRESERACASGRAIAL